VLYIKKNESNWYFSFLFFFFSHLFYLPLDLREVTTFPVVESQEKKDKDRVQSAECWCEGREHSTGRRGRGGRGEGERGNLNDEKIVTKK